MTIALIFIDELMMITKSPLVRIRSLAGRCMPLVNAFLLVWTIVGVVGCSRSVDESEALQGARDALISHRAIGEPAAGLPWITGIEVVDLDKDGMPDVVFSEGRLNQVVWLRNVDGESFEELVIDSSVAGPAGLSVVDVDNDGDLDVAVGGMGIVTPNDQKIGSFSVLINDGEQSFVKISVLEEVSRVARVEAGDFDEDGNVDFVLAMFGYFEGESRVLFGKGNADFDEIVISMLEGAVDAPVADYDNDGDLDIALLVSQDWEEVYLYENKGNRRFEQRFIWGSDNKDFGSSGLVASDLDKDGRIDLIYTNGDGFDYATPGARPWHGVQWLANRGDGNFEYRRIGDQLGSYSPLVTDFDRDGDFDIIVCCAFNDWSSADADSLVCFVNEGNEVFRRVSLAKSPTHLITIKEGDFDADGDFDFVTGALHFYPPYDRLSRISVWER